MRHERHTHLLKSMQINTNSKLNTKHIYRFLQIKKQALFQKYTRFHEKKNSCIFVVGFLHPRNILHRRQNTYANVLKQHVHPIPCS